MNDDILKSVSQGSNGAYDEENRRIREISDELQRLCRLHEKESREGKGDGGRFEIEQRAAGRKRVWHLCALILRIDPALMIASPDERRGRWMLSEIMANGNFGQFSPLWQKSVWKRFFFNRLHRLQMMRFDWQETLWIELGYWKSFILRIPLRIKYRRLSLMPDRQYVCKM